jgi:hypothetical protein
MLVLAGLAEVCLLLEETAGAVDQLVHQARHCEHAA